MTHYEDENNELDFITKPQADIHYINSTGDDMKGNLNMGNNRITNLGNPLHLKDAANKSYVDEQTLSFILKDGGELESDLDCKDKRLKNVKWPDDAKDAVPRHFLTSYSLLLKAPPIDAYDARNKRITDVADCTADKDAANKHYVDSKFISKDRGQLVSDLDCNYKILKNLASPLSNKDAVNKEYFQDFSLGFATLNPLNPSLIRWYARNYRIMSLGLPIDNNDAANKIYVDDTISSRLNSIPAPTSDTSAVSNQWVSTFVGTSLTDLDSTGLAKVVPFFLRVSIFNTVGSLNRDTEFNVTKTIYQSQEAINLNSLRITYQIQQHRVNEENAIVATLEPLFSNRFYSVTSCKLMTLTEGHILRVKFSMKAKKGAPHIFYMQGTLYVFKDPIVLEDATVDFRIQTRSEDSEEE